ncbi:MAG: DUF3604 domain-containing protein [Proteobacteria bacterium]|nr:DUF3604 domain-containing protein [Pseudomonadota bacterium]
MRDADGPPPPPPRPYPLTEEREACESYDPLRQPLFGDTHIHTALSFDARSQDTRALPPDAYRFARGEALAIQPYDAHGQGMRTVKLRRPLDFAALTDHAEMMGEVRICERTDLPGSQSDMCWSWRALKPLMFGVFATRNLIARQRWAFCGGDAQYCLDAARSVWGEVADAAEGAYDRSAACRFTSFVGYEWTASVENGTNLHRNVIFRNAQVPPLPPSWVETPSAADLWDHLERDCLDGVEGCDVLTIPHNSNLGSGLMFASAGARGLADIDRPVTEVEAQRRQRFEPIIEIMQHKGDSECLLGGDTSDEACGFEKLPYNSFAGVNRVQAQAVVDAGVNLTPRRREMVRQALKRGLAEEDRLGVNPLKYGIIASTDSHLATPGLVHEADAVGHGGAGIGAGMGVPAGLPDNPEFNPGGLAVVWAEENARDSIFAGLLRRETYGTSGPRPIVRFFGGWDYPEDLCGQEGFAAAGYAGGVPMGGDLPAAPEGAGAPRFAVWAQQDAGSPDSPGTPLQRIQVVKGWLADGELRENVYDVAGGDNDAVVDLNTCQESGEGHQELCSVWTDPDFDAGDRAFYYVRVLENPTCRWSQRLCVAAAVNCADPENVAPGYAPCCAEDHRPVIQERAWTSPIWYAPN